MGSRCATALVLRRLNAAVVFLGRRVLSSVVTLAGAVLLAYLAGVYVLPGTPCNFASFPLWLGRVFLGDFGRSCDWFGTPVAQILAPAARWTLLLVSTSGIAALALGLAVGSLSAVFQHTILDYLLS